MDNLREMLITTPSRDLRNVHKDVWRLACRNTDRVDGRTFLFALAGDGRVLVRGPHLLPAPHSRAVDPLRDGQTYRFVLDARTIHRGSAGENLVAQQDVPDWLAARLPGFALLETRASMPRRRLLEANRTLPYRTIAGMVNVTDAQQAQKVLFSGVGRGKAFGFGMLVLLQRVDTVKSADAA